MYIYGTSQIHAAQPVNPPHRLTPTHSTSGSYGSAGVDQLDISPEADFVAQARELPEKLDVALSRLLDEIA
jgi:negative regulator of flagellin synthesis FlgM